MRFASAFAVPRIFGSRKAIFLLFMQGNAASNPRRQPGGFCARPAPHRRALPRSLLYGVCAA